MKPEALNVNKENIAVVKEDIKRMWKDVFADDDKYIEMVIENYYSPDYCRQYYLGNRLVSSSLVIPYEFRYLSSLGSGVTETTVTAEYLSGLMTRAELRGKGIMKTMMTEIEAASTERKSCFTFLIPASERLRRYYEKNGYHNSAPLGIITVNISEETVGDIIKIKNEYNIDALLSNIIPYTKKISRGRRDVLRKERYEALLPYISLIMEGYKKNIDLDGNGVYVMHDSSQWKDVLFDVYNSNGYIVVIQENKDRIDGMIIVHDDGRIFPIFGSDEDLISLILNHIFSSDHKRCFNSNNPSNYFEFIFQNFKRANTIYSLLKSVFKRLQNFLHNESGNGHFYDRESKVIDKGEVIKSPGSEDFMESSNDGKFDIQSRDYNRDYNNELSRSTSITPGNAGTITMSVEPRTYGMVKFNDVHSNEKNATQKFSASDIHFLLMLD